MKNNKLGLAVALGVAIGTAIGVATDNLGLWIAIGVAIGAGVGTTLMKQGGKKMMKSLTKVANTKLS